MVNKCEICQKYLGQNEKEPLIQHKILERPWMKIASDILTVKTRNYLIAIDYYSNWLEIIKLKGKTAQELISKFQEMFARNGVPEEFVSDNMPFNSLQLEKFAKDWDITNPFASGFAKMRKNMISLIIGKRLCAQR